MELWESGQLTGEVVRTTLAHCWSRCLPEGSTCSCWGARTTRSAVLDRGVRWPACTSHRQRCGGSEANPRCAADDGLLNLARGPARVHLVTSGDAAVVGAIAPATGWSRDTMESAVFGGVGATRTHAAG